MRVETGVWAWRSRLRDEAVTADSTAGRGRGRRTGSRGLVTAPTSWTELGRRRRRSSVSGSARGSEKLLLGVAAGSRGRGRGRTASWARRGRGRGRVGARRRARLEGEVGAEALGAAGRPRGRPGRRRGHGGAPCSRCWPKKRLEEELAVLRRDAATARLVSQPRPLAKDLDVGVAGAARRRRGPGRG